MDYHNKMLEEKDVKIKELEVEIQRLKRVMEKCLVVEDEKTKRLKYLENILSYLENKLAL